MKSVKSWLITNKLTLNVKKTRYMLVGSQLKLSQINDKFTDSLSWRPHIDAMSKKISAALAVLRRVSPIVPLKTRQNMYNALVISYFNYYSPVWGNIGKGLSDKLQKLQNRAPRIFTFSSCENHSSDLLDELGWQKLELQRLKQLAVVMYKSIIIFPHRT